MSILFLRSGTYLRELGLPPALPVKTRGPWLSRGLLFARSPSLLDNIAARLAAQADGGEIVISESTLARLGASLPVEDLGVRELKNVERPMRLFRLS